MSEPERSSTVELPRISSRAPLILEVSDASGTRTVPLPEGEQIVGSSADASIRLEDEAVSERHVALTLSGGYVAVRDLGSKNGTFLGSARVTDALAGPGTIVSVGNSSLQVRVRDLEEDEAEEPFEPLPGLIGTSKPMRALARTVRGHARLKLPVLVMGESGSGKELVAHALHLESQRARGPFIALNVTCLPRELVESELFGHERGSFTGAITKRRGAFAEAEGGTLFLDEIGDLPLEAQPKLLRALDGYGVRSVGASAPAAQPDVRVVAATHAPLARRVADSEFRRDLFHRLDVLTIHVPPLRSRPGDIGALARMFLHRLAADIGQRKELTTAALARLTSHAWPGNVRELRNVLARAAAGAPGRMIDAVHVDAALGLEPSEARRLTPALAKALVAEHAGNVTRAARAAGCARSTLRKLLAG
jgi:DNA-binding NtrC family response regulator